MKNLFSRSAEDDTKGLRRELVALGDRLDRVASVLEALALRTDAALAGLPDAVVLRALAEVRSAAADATAAAAATVRRHVIEAVLKWGWRGVLAYVGTQLLLYGHTVAEGLHK